MTTNISPQLAERQKRIEARRAQLASRRPKPQTIRVEPANDDMRKYLKHPRGRPFPEGSGSVEWPLDRFTQRRLADGSVKAASTESHTAARPHARQRESA